MHLYHYARISKLFSILLKYFFFSDQKQFSNYMSLSPKVVPSYLVKDCLMKAATNVYHVYENISSWIWQFCQILTVGTDCSHGGLLSSTIQRLAMTQGSYVEQLSGVCDLCRRPEGAVMHRNLRGLCLGCGRVLPSSRDSG